MNLFILIAGAFMNKDMARCGGNNQEVIPSGQ
jgi:hypothetical protein